MSLVIDGAESLAFRDVSYAEERPKVRATFSDESRELALQWRKLTRAATFVALLTAPAFFLILFDSDHWSLAASLIITAFAVVTFKVRFVICRSV